MTDPAFKPDPPVARRAVFFIPGFDPFGPRRYRELYRKQAAAQAAASGYEIAVKGTPRDGEYSWTITADIDGQRTESGMTVLRWNDLVRGAMGRTVWDSYREMLSTVWLYVSSGAFRALWRLRPVPMLIALYPPIIMALYVVIATWLAWELGEWIGGLPGLALGLVLFVGLVILSRRRDRWLKVYYLMSDYAFTAQDRGATPAELAARLDTYAGRDARALGEGVDEVHLDGHRTRARLAVQPNAREPEERAFDNAELYDYFRITGGPETLRSRFGARGSTASRIETVLSPHRDI